MALHRAVGCDTTGCLALYLARPQAGADLVLFAARQAGWDVTAGGLAMRCPSCHAHGPAVTERGDCPVCMGATYDGRRGETCRYCGHTTPYPAVDEIGDLLAVVEDQDHGQEDEPPRLEGATAYAEGSVRLS